LMCLPALWGGRRVARAIGLWSGLSGLASAVGPFVGGWLIAAAGWRWVFLINLPIAAAVVYGAQRHVPETKDPGAARRLDLAGAALGALGLAGITWALVAAGEAGFTPATVTSAAVGAAPLALFVQV